MNRIAHAQVVDPAEQTLRDRVFFGATVTYANGRDEAITVTIVGVDEADMGAGKISVASPVALALLGARLGDEVSVRTPRGTEMLEIVEIVYPAHPLPAEPIGGRCGSQFTAAIANEGLLRTAAASPDGLPSISHLLGFAQTNNLDERCRILRVQGHLGHKRLHQDVGMKDMIEQPVVQESAHPGVERPQSDPDPVLPGSRRAWHRVRA